MRSANFGSAVFLGSFAGTDVEPLTPVVRGLQSTIATQSATLAERETFINSLLEQIRLARHQRFGASSKKLNDEQLRLFNEGEVESQAFEDDETGRTGDCGWRA